MRRAALAVVSTVAGLVLLLGFKTHSPSAATTPPSASSGSASGAGSSGSGSPAAGAAKKSAAKKSGGSSNGSAGASAGAARTITGSAVMTQYGPVQVRVTVQGSDITAVKAIEYPAGTARDQQISYYAIPTLAREAVSADSAHINLVSGATYTSSGYIQSLQSALDRL